MVVKAFIVVVVEVERGGGLLGVVELHGGGGVGGGDDQWTDGREAASGDRPIDQAADLRQTDRQRPRDEVATIHK